MPKLHTSKDIIKVLQKRGFVYISQKGSHAKFRKTGSSTLTVIVPVGKREIPLGTFRSILRQANLSGDDFRRK